MPLSRDAFVVTSADCRSFARLSGDVNPIHIDPVLARRLRFGGAVVHGINCALRALDLIVGQRGEACRFGQLGIRFDRPVRPGDELSLLETNRPGRYHVLCDGKRALRLDVDFSDPIMGDIATRDACPPKERARDLSLDDARGATGSVPLFADREGLSAMYPALVEFLPLSQLAALLASTRIVGMLCPGLHSIFVQLTFNFDDEAAAEVADLQFRADTVDERMGIVEIALTGPRISGGATSMFRAPPAVQSSYSDVAGLVRDDEFANQKAIVVGGSRGLGEVAAKLVAAGGGETLITYHLGREDAAAVEDDITSNGGLCRSIHLDVTSPDDAGDALEDWGPTHLYYFASPPIHLNQSHDWDRRAFDAYYRIFVEAFYDTVRFVRTASMRTGGALSVMMPSTVFLDEAIPGVAEYAAAKAAAESVARHLEAMDSGVHVFCPRLPRLRTDQTAAASASDPVPVILREVRAISCSKLEATLDANEAINHDARRRGA